VALARQGKVPPGPGVLVSQRAVLRHGLRLLWRADHSSLEIGSVREVWAWIRRRFERRKPSIAGRHWRRFGAARFRAAAYSAPAFPKYSTIWCCAISRSISGWCVATFVVLMLVFNFFEMLSDIFRNRVPLVTVGEYLIRVIPTSLYEPLLP